MNIISVFYGIAKKELSPKFFNSSLRKKLNNRAEEAEPDIDLGELKRRYRNVVYIFYISLIFGVLSLTIGLSVSGVIGALTGVLSGLIGFTYALRCSYLALKTRIVFSDWDSGVRNISLSWGEYFDEILSNPAGIFPLSLK